MEKLAAYTALCRDIKKYYSTPQTYHCGKQNITLCWEPACEEINLWTYWQGRGNLNPKILLVGQDWGAPSDDPDIMNTIQRMNNDEPVLYMDHHTTSPTDENLVKLFAALGYAIDREDPRNQDLFFTNLIPGYREHGLSGGYQHAWLTQENQAFFQRLVDILNPRVILCLGKSTFDGVMESLGAAYARKKPFNQQIESSAVKVYVGNSEIAVFPLAHCGAIGTMNRNRDKQDIRIKEDRLILQKEDWRKIAIYL